MYCQPRGVLWAVRVRLSQQCWQLGFSGWIMRRVHPLSFQTQRQYIEATNESNRIFLYCAFLDFRYYLRGRVPGREGSRGGAGGAGGGPGCPCSVTRLSRL